MYRVIRGKMRHFFSHNEFSVCPVEKQISSIYDIKIELPLSAFQPLFLLKKMKNEEDGVSHFAPHVGQTETIYLL